MKRNNNRDGISSQRGERILLFLLLAIGVGSSVFFFFLNSRDMKSAQIIAVWIQNTEEMLDRIALDIGNAVQIEHPFDGNSNHCMFKRSVWAGAFEPSLETEGFMIAEDALNYTGKTASGANLIKPYHGVSSPLISGIHSGQFERLGPRLLRLTLKVKVPDAPDALREFERNIFLKNQ